MEWATINRIWSHSWREINNNADLTRKEICTFCHRYSRINKQLKYASRHYLFKEMNFRSFCASSRRQISDLSFLWVHLTRLFGSLNATAVFQHTSFWRCLINHRLFAYRAANKRQETIGKFSLKFDYNYPYLLKFNQSGIMKKAIKFILIGKQRLIKT